MTPAEELNFMGVKFCHLLSHICELGLNLKYMILIQEIKLFSHQDLCIFENVKFGRRAAMHSSTAHKTASDVLKVLKG